MKQLILILSLFIAGLPSLHAYYDTETGEFLTRDPAGFVDGPNVYTYVKENPWTHFDPEGLFVGGLDQAEAIEVATDEGKSPSEVHQAGQQAYQANIDAGPLVLNGAVSSLPGVQEFQSTQTLQDPSASTLDKTLAAVSLVPLPELGALKSAAKDAETVGKDAKAVAQETGAAASGGVAVAKPTNNKLIGNAREVKTDAELKAENPGASVQSERMLVDADGNKVIDPVTGTGRRVDHAVIDPETNTAKTVETTGPKVNKNKQEAKEKRVREAGGTNIIDQRTGNPVPAPGASTIRRQD